MDGSAVTAATDGSTARLDIASPATCAGNGAETSAAHLDPAVKRADPCPVRPRNLHAHRRPVRDHAVQGLASTPCSRTGSTHHQAHSPRTEQRPRDDITDCDAPRNRAEDVEPDDSLEGLRENASTRRADLVLLDDDARPLPRGSRVDSPTYQPSEPEKLWQPTWGHARSVSIQRQPTLMWPQRGPDLPLRRLEAPESGASKAGRSQD